MTLNKHRFRAESLPVNEPQKSPHKTFEIKFYNPSHLILCQ